MCRIAGHVTSSCYWLATASRLCNCCTVYNIELKRYKASAAAKLCIFMTVSLLNANECLCKAKLTCQKLTCQGHCTYGQSGYIACICSVKQNCQNKAHLGEAVVERARMFANSRVKRKKNSGKAWILHGAAEEPNRYGAHYRAVVHYDLIFAQISALLMHLGTGHSSH